MGRGGREREKGEKKGKGREREGPAPFRKFLDPLLQCPYNMAAWRYCSLHWRHCTPCRPVESHYFSVSTVDTQCDAINVRRTHFTNSRIVRRGGWNKTISSTRNGICFTVLFWFYFNCTGIIKEHNWLSSLSRCSDFKVITYTCLQTAACQWNTPVYA